MLDEEIAKVGEEALEHFGIKGMRWGVRNVQPSESTGEGGAPVYYELHTKSDRQLGKKVAIGAAATVAAAAVITVGAAAATMYLGKHGGTSMSSLGLSPTSRIKLPKLPKLQTKSLAPTLLKTHASVLGNAPRRAVFDKAFDNVGKVAASRATAKEGSQFARNTLAVMGNRPRAEVFGTAAKIFGR